MMKYLAIAIIGVFYTALSFATELTGAPEELRTYLKSDRDLVTIVGQAEILAYSDSAEVTLIVAAREKTLSEALKSNSATRDGLTQTLTASDIDSEMIKSTEFSSSPHYGLFGKKPNNYEVLNRLTITIANEAQLQTVSTIADNQEDTTIGSVVFVHSNKKAAEVQAKDEAIDDALASAETYSKKLGLTLKPVSFSFNNVRSRQSKSSMMIEEVVVTAARKGGPSAGYSRPSPPPVSFDEIKYEASVNVTFEVAQE